jgi:hypothetical protein
MERLGTHRAGVGYLPMSEKGYERPVTSSHANGWIAFRKRSFGAAALTEECIALDIVLSLLTEPPG